MFRLTFLSFFGLFLLSAPASAADRFADSINSFTPGDSTDQAGTPLGNSNDNGDALSLGHGGVIVLDFTDNAIFNRNGPDFTIIEAGDPEGISVEAWNGSAWISLGTGNGTTSFDLGNYGFAPHAKVTRIRITDDDVISADDYPNGGYDLDGVTVFDTAAWNVILTQVSSSYLPTIDNEATISFQIDPSVPGKVRLELFDASTEPGYAMNADTTAFADGTNDPDFLFATQTGWTIHNRFAMTQSSSATSGSGKLSCDDYGAYGKVRAKISSIDGHGDLSSQSIGHVDGGETEWITVPRDDDGNFIADGWIHNSGLATDDNDNDPAGDGVNGDGLSRYQEYRGFIISGSHVRTDPAKKDVFVWNSDSLPGDFLTTSNLGAPVHYVTSTEVKSTTNTAQTYRDINAETETAHINRQTAIRVEEDASTTIDGLWGEIHTTSNLPDVPNRFIDGFVYTAEIRSKGADIRRDINSTVDPNIS